MEYEYELYHHGVKGMKWGVRRTKAQLGYKISKGFKRAKKAAVEKVKIVKAKKEEQKKASKSVKDMTDSELRERINRLSLEQRALDLERQISNLSPQKVSAGQKFVTETGGKMLSSLGSAASKVAGEYIERQLKNSLGLNKKESNPLKDLEDSVKKLELQSREANAKRNLTLVEEFYDKRSRDNLQDVANEAQRKRAAEYLRRKRKREHGS